MKVLNPEGLPCANRVQKRGMPARQKQRLVRRVAAFADSLKRDHAFARVIASDLVGFRAGLLLALKAAFPLRRGRPADPLLDAACEKVKHGKSVPEVLRSQISAWNKLDPYTRYLAAKGLRQAVARRKRRQKGRVAAQ